MTYTANLYAVSNATNTTLPRRNRACDSPPSLTVRVSGRLRKRHSHTPLAKRPADATYSNTDANNDFMPYTTSCDTNMTRNNIPNMQQAVPSGRGEH